VAIPRLSRARLQGPQRPVRARRRERHLGHRADPDHLSDPAAPDDIRQLAEARRAARAERRFADADALKADLEAAGWKVTDAGGSYRLEPLHPVDVVEGGRTQYGWSGAVPLRDPDAAVGASVVVVATDAADDLERQLASLAGSVNDSVQRIVVANGPSPELAATLLRWSEQWAAERGEANAEVDDLAASTELVWLASRLPVAAALNAGIRRAAGEVVVVLGPGVEAAGDLVSPLVAALDDAAVAVAGPWGLVSDDQRHFEPAGPGGGAVAAIDLACIAFRRADAMARGPLDERFEGDALLGAWWSLVLRDAGDEGPARRAAVVDVPAVRSAPATVEDDPAERRNRYRLIDCFGNRSDLAVS
jgi:hypothetical protein